tara:strand:- start:943 stop:1164 length:222 start_codon:yes stop_codon:yes gene_type:complete
MNQGIITYGVHEGCVHEGGGLHKHVFLKKEDAVAYMVELANEEWRLGRFKKISETEYRADYDIITVIELELHS